MGWVKDGEKFAFLGLNIELGAVEALALPGDYTLLQEQLSLPEHWKGWLGSQRVEEVEACPAYLAIKMTARQPGVLDGDDQRLRSLIGHWYWGILLQDRFVNLDDPFILAGSWSRTELHLRHFEMIDGTGRAIAEHYPSLAASHIEGGFALAKVLRDIAQEGAGQNWRLRRCLAIYQESRAETDILDRVHQFVRCIEGLIVSEPGQGKPRFKSRTELFVGPRHHDFMGDLYELRGHIEHLHENQHLEEFDRNARLEIARKEAVSEFVARTCLVRILSSDTLRRHFGNVNAARAFWLLDRQQQAELWGKPVDMKSALQGINFDHVSDQELGKTD